jgi:uncharacterized protein
VTGICNLDANKDRLLAARAVIEDYGTGSNGSLYILDTDDRKEAKTFFQRYSFYQVGLFAKVEIRRWRKDFYNKQRLV